MDHRDLFDLPERDDKPREHGLSAVLDGGEPLGRFTDVIDSHHQLIDLVKFGWCTGLISSDLEEKVDILNDRGIAFHFGGTLFEKAVLQDRVDAFRDFCREVGAEYIEISNGTIDLSNDEKADYIRQFSDEFQVVSEVGYKDAQRSLELHPAKWIEFIKQDFEAGSDKVITEARQSGKSGIVRADGEVRYGLITEIVTSAIDIDDLIFEAPNKSLQVYFIKKLGPNVNLGNIALEDIVGLETLRLGLRGDTLLDFEEGVDSETPEEP